MKRRIIMGILMLGVLCFAEIAEYQLLFIILGVVCMKIVSQFIWHALL